MPKQGTAPSSQPELFSQEPSRVVYFDIETKKLSHEVGGWGHRHLMEVSCAVVFREEDQRFVHFREEEIQGLWQEFENAQEVVGYNSKGFDLKVLAPYFRGDIFAFPHLDMLEHIERVLGFRVSLDHLAEVNLSERKSGSGTQAVEWYRKKEWDKLITYCQKDVELTRRLHLLGKEQKYLYIQDKRRGLMKVPCTW